MLGQIGSDLIFPHDHHFAYNDEVKELRLCAAIGNTAVHRDMSFENRDMIDWTMENSNVVINLLGPRRDVKRRNDYEYINIEVPKRIAQAAAKNPNIKRLIHFSSAGAYPDAESLDLQTKYYGEQEVLDAFPNATIFRLCTMVGANDWFTRIWLNHW
jgi:nucleoside-diphosphate-sugar epimerase